MYNVAITSIFLQLAFCLIAGEDENVYVRINQGLLKGKSMTSRNGSKFFGFLKLPYAQPPLGQLRFKAPREPVPWEGVRDATQDGVICTQRNIYVKTKFFVAGEEDCLYLNVFTPKVNQTDEKDLLPVMFFIHGGGWVTGSGNSLYYPPQYLLDKEIVFVSLNYRLGPLGFLSMEDADLPGNLGLKDQNQALKWVQKNIKAFGGNPNSVTIFGESAGGASVHYHMMSSKSKGLFHRGISQSGTALCSWALGHPGVTRNNTIKLAEVLKCPTTPTSAMVDCLREKPVEEIIQTDIHFMEWFKEPMIPFKPVVETLAKPEDKFIEEHPEDAIKNGRIADVPWITGINSGDGALRVAGHELCKAGLEEMDFTKGPKCPNCVNSDRYCDMLVNFPRPKLEEHVCQGRGVREAIKNLQLEGSSGINIRLPGVIGQSLHFLPGTLKGPDEPSVLKTAFGLSKHGSLDCVTLRGFYDDYNLVKELDKDFNRIVPMSLFYRETASDVLETTKLIRNFYFGNNGVNNDTFQSVTDLWTDGWFLAGADDAVRLMYSHGKAPVYYYYFSYRGTLSFSSVFGDTTRDYGVCHADELIYLFPTERLFPNVQFTNSDKKFMNVMLDLWTNFAKYGEPTPNEIEGKWEPVSSDRFEYLHLGKDEIAMSFDLLPERTKFWASLKTPKKFRKDEL